MIKQEPDKKIIEEIITLFNNKKLERSLKLSQKLLKEYPNSLLINNLTGVIQTELKNYSLAKDLFTKVIKLNSKFADGFYNLANINSKLNDQDEAIKNYKKVIDVDKNYFKAYNNLGNIYRNKGWNRKALENYIITLIINPNYKRAYYNLGGVLQHYTLEEKNKYINKFLLHLLNESKIVRPNAIATNVINALYLNTDLKDYLELVNHKLFHTNFDKIVDGLSNNLLLNQFMKVCPIPSYYIESNFKKIRKELLNQINSLNFNKLFTKFATSLSIQCFLNEYVYFVSEKEEQSLEKLKKTIETKYKNNQEINDLEILCLSCYAPLNSFTWANNITNKKSLSEVYNLQIKNFQIEKNLSKKIQSISKIKNKISVKVRNQYEENPYPRWTNLGLSINEREIKDVINDISLNIDLKKINFSNNPDILIAGCGTGQHAITTASKYKRANIYALDLSMNSLSYAKRKAEELGFKNIKFIQGDLLDLKRFNKKFDIIESVGVLHHMDNPEIGWKVLKENLKNHGLMLIGLYSEKARKNIADIRMHIIKSKIETHKKSIINFRNEILSDEKSYWNNIKYSPDFYSLSGVRDLLFHVKEHRYDIPKLNKIMKKLNLKFVGFEDKFVVEKFKKIFNNPNDLYELKKWESFENKNQRIFAGMYQFWCQQIN